MAILYGTTPDGQTFPVQVNEFGQLVAKGLPGEKGDQGDQGPVGPPGDFQFTSGTFEPVFTSSDESGAGVIDYETQSGYWYRFGPLLTVQIYIKTSSVTLTNIRGYLLVTGLPDEVDFATPAVASAYGPYSLNYLAVEGKGTFTGGRVKWWRDSRGFQINAGFEGGWTEIDWADLDGSILNSNTVAFTWSGLASDAVPSVRIPLDELV